MNILLFLIGTNQFERSTFEFLAQQLALRHQKTVTTVKAILIPEEPRLVQPRLHLVREKLLKDLLPKSLYEPLQTVGGVVSWRENYDTQAFEYPYWTAHNYSCDKMLNSNLMGLLSKDQIDVAIVYAGNPCQLAIGIPFIYFDLKGFTQETIVASNTPWQLTDSSPSLSLASRIFARITKGLSLTSELLVQSSIPYVSELLSARYLRLDAAIDKIFSEDYEIRRKFKRKFPDVNQIKQSAELYLLNTDLLLEEPSLSLPSYVHCVGGIHIDEVKPLFYPWNSSIAEAKEGLIIVSLGTQVDTSKMPAVLVKTMLNVFSKLKDYRIFWRIGGKLALPGIDDLETIPSHINITTFIPQNELLANRRTRLFITNGGMNSVMEAVAHGVAILEQTLMAKLKELLNNPKYARTAKEMSKEFKSRPSTAFQRALHAIEHVGRHRSAKFYSPQKPESNICLRVSNKN
uniref:glucuronosyltransferase n=1 Tax=Ditylenchus dipsaci TaxID=166011 RepID=A0A915DVF0_9BILA